MPSFFFIFKNTIKNICLAIFFASIAFAMIKFFSFEMALVFAVFTFISDAISTRISTRKGFVEKNPLYIMLRTRLNFTKSVIVYALVYVSFLGVMHLSNMLFEALLVIGLVHGFGFIHNTLGLFIQKSQEKLTVK